MPMRRQNRFGPDRFSPGRRAVVIGALALPLMGFRSFQSLFAPDAELWPRWEAHDPQSSMAVDWAAWDTWLASHVIAGPDGITRIDYGAVTAEERTRLDRIIDALAAVPVSGLNRDAQMAYWLNLYNAVTVKLILDHYPVESIRDIKLGGGLFGGGPWDASLVEVEGQPLTLNEIEHRILRPIWQDPRIHYGVNCASIGCPNLWPTAWMPETLDAELDAAARAFVRHPRGVEITRRGGEVRVTVSSIYDWFVEDFGGTERGVLAHLQRHATPETAAQLAELRSIDGSAYDWSLNDAGAVD